MPKPTFSVIIVSWNVERELGRCLTSLEQEREAGADFGVRVVDNASHDGSAELVRQKFPWVKLVVLTKNVGFAAACNLATTDSEADYLVFLNPDTEVTAGFFSDLARAFIHHPQASVIGGHILNEDGTTQPSVRGFPGLWVGTLEALKLLARLPWLAPQYLQLDFNYNQAQAVPQIMGACLAVRRQVWQELNGFDEQFFVWFEEVDFCQRVRKHNYEVWYEPRLTLIHSQGQSFAQLTYTERHRQFMRSLVKYLKKHQGVGSAGLVWLLSRPVFIVTYLYDYAVAKNTH